MSELFAEVKAASVGPSNRISTLNWSTECNWPWRITLHVVHTISELCVRQQQQSRRPSEFKCMTAASYIYGGQRSCLCPLARSLCPHMTQSPTDTDALSPSVTKGALASLVLLCRFAACKRPRMLYRSSTRSAPQTARGDKEQRSCTDRRACLGLRHLCRNQNKSEGARAATLAPQKLQMYLM